MSFWLELKRTGLPAVAVLLPSFLWLALTCAALQASVLPVLLVGKRREYYIASRWIFTLLHRPLVYLFEYSGSKAFLHGDAREKVLDRLGHDQAIILANHNSDLDWLLGLLILDAGGGVGCCKAIIKRSLLAVPFFGFVWWGVDFVCINRNWAADSSILQEGFKIQQVYRECVVPYVLTIFPEGTRLSLPKLLECQEWARSRSLPVMQHVLCPRTKGVWSALNGLRLDSVYDATMSPARTAIGGHANLVNLASGEPCELHIHMERLDPDSIPRDEEGVGKWLFSRWELKERRLETFAKEQHFGGADGGTAAPEDVAVRLAVRPSAAWTTLGAIVWWLFCTAAFARWCVLHGHVALLIGCSVTFVLMVASLGLVLHQVHFRKDAGGGNGAAPKDKAC